MENLNNKEYRAKLRKDPHSVLNYISKDIDIIVKTNTKKTIYMAISHIDNKINDLSQISAAGTAGSASSASSLGTLSTFLGSFGTVMTVGSIATAGSADTDAADITLGQ